MKDAIKYTIITIVCLALLTGGIFLIRKVVAPASEELRREVFENSRTFNEGKIQQLSKYYLEWINADEAEKEAIESVIQLTFTDFKLDRIPESLKSFFIEARGY